MRYWVMALGCVVAACSADGSDSGIDRRSGGAGVPFTGAAGVGGTATAGTDTAGTGFGNTMVMAPDLPSEPPATEPDVCMPGERCFTDTLDTDDCGALMLDTGVVIEQHPGNVTIVFDRSGSMNDPWDTRTKSQAAGEAIQAALSPIADLMTVGAIMFPSPDQAAATTCAPLDFLCALGGALGSLGGNCLVNPIAAIDQIPFTTGADFLVQFPQKWALGSGRTPLGDGIRQAAEALSTSTWEGTMAVVVITDGEPNCSTDMNAVYAQADAWLAQDIKTHVIGLPGAGPAASLLQELATRGGTNTFIEPTDPAALEQRLSEIVGETITGGIDTCSITVDPPAADPDKVFMVVTENGVEQSVPRDLSAEATWNVSATGDLITLEGLLCQDAMDGRFENVTFKFGCVDLPPLPPDRPE